MQFGSFRAWPEETESLQKVHLDFNLKLSRDILVFCESNTKAEIQESIRSHLNRQLVIIRLDYKEFLWSGSSEAIKSEEF